MSKEIKADELNSKTVEIEKIVCPCCLTGVAMVSYDKRHRPKINVFGGS